MKVKKYSDGIKNLFRNKNSAPYLALIFSVILGYQNCSHNNLGGGYSPTTNTFASQTTNNTSGVTSIYRSVGPGNTNPLACGSSLGTCVTPKGSLTISGTMATFAVALPNNIGVGDAIFFDCNGNSSLGPGDCLAFITSRIDGLHYAVQNISGGTPKPYAGGSVWAIFRAYTSLANILDFTAAGTANFGISALNPAFSNFDNSTGGTNLVTANEQLNVALYADAVDTKPVSIQGLTGTAGWTTSPQNNIRVYAPYLPSDVGVSQRHYGGAMGLQGYQLTVTCAGCSAISIFDVDLTLEGLQIYEDIPSVSANPGGSSAIYVEYDNTQADLIIRDNLIQGADPTSSAENFYGIHIPQETTGSNIYIYNNVIYNFKNSLAKGFSISSSGNSLATIYVYNNTTHGSDRCINNSSPGAMIAKNNIATGCTVGSDYLGIYDPSSVDNISDDVTSPTVGKRSETVAFMNATTGDLRLSPTDTTAKNQGIDLSMDAYLPFNTDIAGVLRPLGAPWSIGASQ